MTERSRPIRGFVIAVACLLTYVVTHAAVPAPAAPPRLDALPMVLSGWAGVPAPPLDPDTARVLAADQYVHRYYQASAGTIEMDVAYYSQPRVGANMHSPLNCLPGNGWNVSTAETMPVATPAGTWDVQWLTVERGRTRYAMAYWFQTRRRVLGSELTTRVSLLGDALHRRPTDAGIVRLMMPLTGTGAEQQTLASFASALIPQLATSLR
jgi:EpsI family protein